MKKREPEPLPPPTMEERAAAAVSARLLKAMLAGAPRGKASTKHIDMWRPPGSLWITTWESLPGFTRVNDQFKHDLLPGWFYKASEIGAQMIPDLEALAERGVRPTEAAS